MKALDLETWSRRLRSRTRVPICLSHFSLLPSTRVGVPWWFPFRLIALNSTLLITGPIFDSLSKLTNSNSGDLARIPFYNPKLYPSPLEEEPLEEGSDLIDLSSTFLPSITINRPERFISISGRTSYRWSLFSPVNSISKYPDNSVARYDIIFPYQDREIIGVMSLVLRTTCDDLV